MGDGQPLSDRELVEECLAGADWAMRQLIERFQRPVFVLCLRMLRQRQDAEDVAQESLARMCRHLAKWDRSRELMPWVLAIAANRCRTALEKRLRRAIPVDGRPESLADGRRETPEIGEELERALGELREEYRICFTLFYEQQCSLAEISEVLEVPTGTIKTWLHRARKELAEILRARGFQ